MTVVTRRLRAGGREVPLLAGPGALAELPPALADAAVGGKTGVNPPRGKNLIGAFYQPLCVVADTGLLATLSPRAFSAGMAEVAKMAMILDADLFAHLEDVAASLGPADAEKIAPI